MKENEYKEMIYKKANEVNTRDDLLKLFDEIEDFNHDYGTIVYACMAAMLGAFKIINNGKQGGITGFQASCLSWECVEQFTMKKPPLKLVAYDDMLFPQYKDRFEKVISQETWGHLKKKAQEYISGNNEHTHPNILSHWQSIVDGKIPFGYEVKDVD